MKVCAKCGNEFKLFIKIDGKQRNLKNRKFCLDCSPFGEHNTRGLISDKKIHESVCISCGRDFVYVREAGHSKGKCNTCWTNEKRRALKIKAIEYLGGQCSVCGYSKCTGALDFHHKDPKAKEFGLSHKNYIKWEAMKAELDKCILLCANCHRELHSGLLA